jgi:NADH-quinone oxidoreductase subunit M
MIQMISHGVVSGALFLCVGVIYDRMHTRDINFYGGLVNRMPIYATVFMIFMLRICWLARNKWFCWRILGHSWCF